VVTITVEPGGAELVLSLSWSADLFYFMGDVFMRNPNGVVQPPFHTDQRHKVWRVTNPMGGDWTLELNEYIIPLNQPNAPDAPDALPPYLVQASIKADVTMDAFITTPYDQRVPGQPVSFVASLTDNAPITGALVLAGVEKPDGTTYNFWMLDDGNHSDGAADDGVYGGTFYQTGQNGSYNVTILGYGYSPVLDANFLRAKILSFHMARVDGSGNELPYLDTDSDTVPDDWEIFFQPWTNPNLPDANADPDNDGSPNKEEWERGTDPGDPDSDDDGEADGTDEFPFDPAFPPLIQPPAIHAYAGISEVFVHYTFTQTHQVVGLFRDEDDDLDQLYTFHTQHISPTLTGIFTDTLVANAHEYCYIAAAIDFDGRRSDFSAPSCAVPNSDPLPPHGWVQINGGAQSTNSPNVQLDLWASDAVDPEVDDFGEQHLPPADSASGVTQMMISNNPAFLGGAWEPYATSKPWALAQSSGLATIYVKYMDAVGNVSDTYVATIWIGQDPATGVQPIYLPLVIRSP
jgi:hypothetical protein